MSLELDKDIIVYGRQCLACARYTGDRRCEAFSLIPEEIISGEADHTKPFTNDKGLRFKPLPEV